MKWLSSRVYLAALPWGIALGLHGVVLFWPLSKSSNVPSKSAAAGRVRVVKSASAPQTLATKDPAAIAKPTASELVVAKRRPPDPVNKQVQPKPAKPLAKPASMPESARSPKVKTQAKVPPSPSGKKPQSPVSPNDLEVDLSRLPDTQPCQQVDECWRSQKSQWRSVYAKVHEQITAQGYRVTELELEDDTGFRVSEIAKNGQTRYYLHLLSTLDGTVYILNPTQLSKDEVEERVSQAQQAG